MRGRLRLAFSQVLTTVMLVWGSATAHAQAATQFDLPSQPLADALRAVGSLTNTNVLFDPPLTAGRQAPALIDELTTDEALNRLLVGTNIRYEYLNEKTIILASASLSTSSSDFPLRVDAVGAAGAAPASAPHEGEGGRKSFWERFRLAQVDQGKTSESSTAVRVEKSSSSAEGSSILEEIIVTGTHIGGIKPAGAAVNVYTRKDIDQSGATSLQQFARTMTENFSNVDSLSNPNSNANLAATGATANFFVGADFNLHGLGPGTTLTLLNGRRLASAGASGDFVDISMIPVAAIERIEVISDGASAIYGSDAISGVVNIITDNDFSGAETRVQYGGTTDGGAETFSASQLLGTAWDSGNVVANLDYNWSGGLDASRRDYIPDLGGPNGILPKNRRASALVAASQGMTDATRLSAAAIYSERDFSFDQTRESLIVNTSTRQEGDVALTDLTLGIEHQFSGDRRMSISAGHSKLRQTNEVLSDYSIGLRFSDTNENVTQVDAVDAVADGTLMSWAGGAIKGALGGGYRSEEFAQDATSNALSVAHVKADRHVTSAFAELFVPIVGNANAVTLVRRLEISAAVRYDDYSDFGSAVNPKWGVVWSPVQGLDLRGTYGTSFRAPLLLQLNQPVSSSTLFFPNPGSPVGFTDTLLVGGGNQELSTEEARTLTAGFAVQPSGLPSLRLSIDYFDIRYRDRIQTPPFDFVTVYTDPAVAPFLNLQPSLAEVQDYFNSPNFRGDFAFDQNGQPLGPEGVEAILDSTYHNIAVTEQAGLSFRGAYDFASDLGDFSLSLTVDRLLNNEFQVTSVTPAVSIVDAFAQPTKWKGRAEVSWSTGSFTTVLAINHVSKYDNTLFTPSQPIDSWTTGDLYVAYNTGDGPQGFLRNMTAALSIVNVTNEVPPHVVIPPDRLLPGQEFIPFDSTNASPLGRLISFSVGKRW